MTSTMTKEISVAYGQAARVENSIDTNLAFSRAYNHFVSRYGRDPVWKSTKTLMDVYPSSIMCEIREERELQPTPPL